jgi:hypothetical protein
VNRLQEVQLTVAEWTELTAQLGRGEAPKWLDFGEKDQALGLEVDTAVDVSEELLSPFVQAQRESFLNLIPSLSYDDSVASSESGFSPEDLELGDIAAYVGKFRSNFHVLKQQWTQAFVEVEAGYGLLVQDLKRLGHASALCQHQIGAKPQTDPEHKSTLWSSISNLQNTVVSVSTTVTGQASQLGDLSQQQTTLAPVITTLEDTADQVSTSLGAKVQVIERDLRATEQRMLKLLPFLNHLKASRGGTPTPSDQSSLIQKVNELSQQFQSLQELVYDQVLASSPSANGPTATIPSATAAPSLIPPSPESQVTAFAPSLSEVLAQLNTVQSEMKQLQLRVVGKGVQIANRTFQSFVNVQTWVTTHLPNRRYGLFVDGVSIFEFFTHGHIDAETTYSSFYSQHRTGFQSTFEARVASSIQNLFPSVFGKSDSNVDTAEALPVLKSPDKWDSNDGNTGLRYQISRNMADVEFQLQETITTVLGPYSEAKHIAQECLHQSKRFALELSQFITTDFQKWRHRGHAPKDAWKMTSVCVRKIFEELYSERVVARDVYDQKDPDFTTAKYLWATWKAHAVMEKYLRHQFYEHPAISAVLAWHLADNYVKPDGSHGHKLKTLDAQVKALETNHQTLQSNYDKLRVASQKEAPKEQQPKEKAKNWKGSPAPGSG